jgi:hypothetical protein
MLTFLRDDVPRNWDTYCDRVTDNFRIINPKDFLITHLPQLPPVRDKLRQINRLPDYASCAATQTSVQIMNIGRFQGSFSNGS